MKSAFASPSNVTMSDVQISTGDTVSNSYRDDPVEEFQEDHDFATPTQGLQPEGGR